MLWVLIDLHILWSFNNELQESLRAKDSQLAVLRVRLQEADDKTLSKDAALAELQAENKR